MFERILLAVDGSDNSDRATEVARELAKASGGEVVVFHARELEMAGRAGVVDLETRAATLSLVDETVRSLKDADVSARGEVRNV